MRVNNTRDIQDRRNRLERARFRLSQGIPEGTMDYYDRFQRFYSIQNTLTIVLTKENRGIMEDRRDDEKIPLWRRKATEWAIEQGDAIKKCARAMKIVAENCATGQERRDNLASRFNSEMAPRSWGQVLDQWIANRDDALAEQRKDEEEERRRTRIITKCRSNGTELQLAEMKIKRLEDSLASQERSYQSLKERLRQVRLEHHKTQMEGIEKDTTCAKKNAKRKRNQPANSSEEDNPYFSAQHRQDSEDHKEEGSSPAGLQHLPFRCSMCSPACKELASSISRGEPGWKDWYKRHPDLDMPEGYKAIPTPTATRSREEDDTAPSGSHQEDSWTHSFFRGGKQVRMKWCGPKRPRNREEVKRPNTRGSKRELALANTNKTEGG